VFRQRPNEQKDKSSRQQRKHHAAAISSKPLNAAQSNTGDQAGHKEHD
jgi:hypothetical protein